MADAALSYVIAFGSMRLPVDTVRGAEDLSKPFRIEVGLALDGTYDADPERFLRSEVTIEIVRGGLGPTEDLLRGGVVERRIPGIATELRLRATVRGASRLTMIVEPRLGLLAHKVDMRVFRDLSVPEVAKTLLAESRVPFVDRLSGSYPPIAYSVQYRESALAFVSRLFEDEGIFHFFDHEGTLVLGDSPSAYAPIEGPAAIPFRMGSGLDTNQDAISELDEVAELGVGTVTLSDFDPARPSFDLSVAAPGPTPGGPEHYEYPGEYTDPAVGLRRASVKAEAFAARADRLEGRSLSPRLAVGHRFEVTGAAHLDEPILVVTRIEHRFDRTGAGFSTRFEALPATRTFRSLQTTPRPEIDHPMPAMVVGPKDTDIHTDPLGRVKVRFPWDRRSPTDDSASDWVPVMQDNTGHSVHIPRTGWEVVAHFLEGDPDRPVVLGRLYNAREPVPEPLPENKTVSAMRSLSSPGRGGQSSIRMDDRAGGEHMNMHAEKDQDVLVGNERRTDVTATGNHEIGGNETIAIAGNLTTTVGADADLEVGADRTITIGGSREVKVSKSDEIAIKGDHAAKIGGLHLRRVRTDDLVKAAKLVEKVGAVDIEASIFKNTLAAKKGASLTVGGAVVELSRKDKSEETKLARAETIGGVLFSKSLETKITALKSRTTRVLGSLKVTSAGPLSLLGKKLRFASKADGFVTADTIVFQVGGASVTLAGGVLKIVAPTISIVASGPGNLHQDDAALA